MTALLIISWLAIGLLTACRIRYVFDSPLPVWFYLVITFFGLLSFVGMWVYILGEAGVIRKMFSWWFKEI